MQNFILLRAPGHLLNTHLILCVCDHGKKYSHLLQLWKHVAKTLKII